MLRYSYPSRRNARQTARSFRAILFLSLALACYVLFLLERQLYPILQETAEYECNRVAMLALESAMDSNPELYTDIYRFQYGPSGEITAIETDAAAINRIQALLGQKIDTALLAQQNLNIAIPLGSLTGVRFLTGRGPRLSFKLMPSSYALTRVYDTLESVGVNQTKMNVYIHFTVDINLILAGYASSMTVENELYLGNVVVFGKIPQSYYGNRS